MSYDKALAQTIIREYASQHDKSSFISDMQNEQSGLRQGLKSAGYDTPRVYRTLPPFDFYFDFDVAGDEFDLHISPSNEITTAAEDMIKECFQRTDTDNVINSPSNDFSDLRIRMNAIGFYNVQGYFYDSDNDGEPDLYSFTIGESDNKDKIGITTSFDIGIGKEISEGTEHTKEFDQSHFNKLKSDKTRIDREYSQSKFKLDKLTTFDPLGELDAFKLKHAELEQLHDETQKKFDKYVTDVVYKSPVWYDLTGKTGARVFEAENGDFLHLFDSDDIAWDW